MAAGIGETGYPQSPAAAAIQMPAQEGHGFPAIKLQLLKSHHLSLLLFLASPALSLTQETLRGEGLGCSPSVGPVLSIHWAEGNSNTVYVIHGNTGLGKRTGSIIYLSKANSSPTATQLVT